MDIEPFRIAIPDDDLRDLAARLARVQWPPELAGDDRQYGTRSAYLRELVDHWRHRFDWHWLTRSFASSARYYYEAAHQPWRPSHDRTPVVEAPTGVAVFSGDILRMPRAWTERYCNVQRYTVMPRGGHFAPMEEPELLVEDIRRFFRPLRRPAGA